MYVKVVKEFKYRSKDREIGEVIEVSVDLANRLAQNGDVVKATEQEYLESKKDDKTEDLAKLKVDELKELAKELGIEDYENLKKAELIAAIESEKES